MTIKIIDIELEVKGGSESSILLLFFCFYFFAVLGFEVKASQLLVSALPIEPHPQPFLLL
jgi:hypothetical protein